MVPESLVGLVLRDTAFYFPVLAVSNESSVFNSPKQG